MNAVTFCRNSFMGGPSRVVLALYQVEAQNTERAKQNHDFPSHFRIGASERVHYAN